ncbi:uncharacterized protein [Aegilops tauschii subsp. strangulata]|uniref:uncharacterized protein n=1 Tax=Aegilops tauschii subsp. strangulata TaxID=200361 RepID=UPI00098B58A2|nr:ethylene-responsive transcription factor 5-like [Aegilops tauschii subsp. strangulata]
MPRCRRDTWGYRGVRARPSGGFSAKIRFREMRLSLDTFDTTHEAARAYDAAVWHLRRPRREMNFPNDIINKREFYMQRRAKREKWRVERATYHEDRRTRKAAAQFNIKLGAASPWDSDDDRYLDTYNGTSEEDITEAESDDVE